MFKYRYNLKFEQDIFLSPTNFAYFWSVLHFNLFYPNIAFEINFDCKNKKPKKLETKNIA